MRGDALFKVECDICREIEEVELTSLAGGGWDERNVDHALKRLKWLSKGEYDFCRDCVEQAQSKPEIMRQIVDAG